MRGEPAVDVFQGVRILEFAQFVFVPAAAALLADWGADVIKIEHPIIGDAYQKVPANPVAGWLRDELRNAVGQSKQTQCGHRLEEPNRKGDVPADGGRR